MTLEIIISLLALLISVVVLVRSRTFNQQQIDLQRVVSDLAQKQLDILNAEEKKSQITKHTNIHIKILPHRNSNKLLLNVL